MSLTTQKIKEKLGIVDVVESYIKLEKAGANYKARCPFHNEKTASFFLSPGRESFYCFGCGVGGDIFNFVEEYEGVDFMGALKILADKSGVPIEKENFKEKKERDRLYEIMDEAVSYYQKNLERHKDVLLYLKKRGLKDETIRDFKIGFVPEGWRNLYNHLSSLKFSDGEIFKAGLSKKADKGFYDTFRGRIMFPISDSAGRPVAFSGRIWGEENAAKYLNSPETELFSKSETLYGYDRAKKTIREKNYCILVEGQFDLLMAHQEGFQNSVAASGTAFSGEMVEFKNNTPYSSRAFAGTDFKSNKISGGLRIIKRHTSNLLIAFDADKAGIGASGRVAKIALPMDFNLKVANMPMGMDPAELILKDKELWVKAIKEAKHVIDFFVDILKSARYDDRKFSLEIRRRILPYIAKIQNKIDKDQFTRKISELLRVSENSIKEEMEKMETEENNPIALVEKEENALPIKVLINKKIRALEAYLEAREESPIAASDLNEKYKKITGEDIPKMETKEIEPIIFEIEKMLSKEDASVEVEANELLLRLEREYAEEELDREIKSMKEAESQNKEAEVEVHLKNCETISKKMDELARGAVNYF